MRKAVWLLLCIALLCGCGDTENRESSVEETMKADGEKLKSEGYENLADIGYAKTEDDSEILKINLVYLSDNAELSIYLYLKMVYEFSNKDAQPAFSITWGEKEYNIDGEEMNIKDFESFINLFPKEWKEVLEKLNDEELTIGNIVDKGSADLIDETVEKFISSHIKEDKKDMDSNNSNDASGESGNIILSRDYEIDGEKATISFREFEGKYKISIIAKAGNEEKASIILLQSMDIFEELKNEDVVYGYDIGVSCGDLVVSYLANGEMQTVFGTDKNGDSVDKLPDWVVPEFAMASEEVENFMQEIQKCIQDFAQGIGELNK